MRNFNCLKTVNIFEAYSIILTCNNYHKLANTFISIYHYHSVYVCVARNVRQTGLSLRLTTLCIRFSKPICLIMKFAVSFRQLLTLCVPSSLLQQSCLTWKLITSLHPLHSFRKGADSRKAASQMMGTGRLLQKRCCPRFHFICYSGTLTGCVWCRQHGQMTEKIGSQFLNLHSAHTIWFPSAQMGTLTHCMHL